jgi:hypothetical protein
VVAFALVPLMAPDAFAASASSTTSVPSASAVALGATVSDTATVSDPSGLGVPSGTVSFFVCGPLTGASGCSSGGTAVGTVSLIQGLTNATAASSSFAPNATGTWCFRAEYSGDSSYSPSSDGSSTECFSVGPATAHVVSTPIKQTTTLAAGDSDLLTITGNAVGGSPSGTVSFSVCGPLTTASGCATGGTAVGGPVPLTAGSNNMAAATSATFKRTSPGVWCFRAEYSGDGNYNPGSDGSVGECFTVRQPGAPSASISLPSPSAIYSVGQGVQANYSCAEVSGGPGLSSCTGTVPDGAPIDTSMRGQQTFSVTAASRDGLSTTVFSSYTVAGPPSVWITSPTNGASYTPGELVGVACGCAEDAFGPGLTSCSVPAAVDTRATGTFPFSASTASLDGQSATITIHYNVVPPNRPPPVTAPVAPMPPALSGVSQSHRRWRLGTRLARLAAAVNAKVPVGTTFRFTLNEAATVRFAFARLLPGRVMNGNCLAQTSANRSHRACTRSVPSGSLSFSAGAGLHKLLFGGRLTRTRKLKPGTYRLTIMATNAAGQRATKTLKSFTIVPG